MVPSLFIAKEPDLGICEAPIGRLDQDETELKENLDSLLASIEESRTNRKNPFITRYET